MILPKPGSIKTASQRQHDWKAHNLEGWKTKRKRNRAAWLAKTEADPVRLSRWKETTRRAQRNSRVAERRRDKAECMATYGGKCACCGEKDLRFLTIDHINGGGRKLREHSGSSFYKWLRHLGFPKGEYQVLCWNCNCGRALNGGVCPHKAVAQWC